jgi:hypothetical protein
MSSTKTTQDKPAQQPQKNGQGRRYLNGAMSGIVEVTLTHWIDVLKTRWQAEAKVGQASASTKSRIAAIYKNEGFKGFYKGYISRVIGIGPMRAVYWGTMDHMTNVLSSYDNLSQTQRLMLAGVGAGAVQSLVDVPIEVVKTQLITGGSNKQDVIKQALQFKGFKSTALRNMGFACVMNFGLNYKRTEQTSYVETYLRSMASGFVAAFTTQPLDYVKTKHQQHGGNQDGIIKMLVEIGKKNPTMLWSGGVWRILLSMSTMSVGATVFIFLNSFQKQKTTLPVLEEPIE